MLEGLTDVEGWWIGPVLLALWIGVGILFYFYLKLRKAGKSDDDQP